MVAPLAAATVTFTRSLPESSATVIVGARRGNGSSPAKAHASEQTGIHNQPATSVWDMALLLRYAKGSLGTSLPPSPLVLGNWLLRLPARPVISKTSVTLSSAPVAD